MSILAHRAPGSVVSLIVAIVLAACAPEAPAPTRSPIVGNTSPVPVETAHPEPATAAPAPTEAPAAMPPALLGAFRESPDPVPPAVLAEAEHVCRTRPVPAYADEIGTRPLVVSDMRGLGVLILVFADATGATGCRVEVDPAGGMSASHFAVSAKPDGGLERGAVTLDALRYPGEGGDQQTIAVGRVGEGAATVRAVFPDDTFVTAAMASGWYVVWWPGGATPSVIVATDGSDGAMGTVTP